MKGISSSGHPFRMLLILEWILLGIAVLAIASPIRLPPPHPVPPLFILGSKIVSLGAIIALGALGLRLPPPSRLLQISYIALGFGLSWFIVVFGGRGISVFPAVLLVVVMRACLIFPWGGRLLVAGIAYGSFLLLQIMTLLEIHPFGLPMGRSLPRMVHRLPPDVLRSVVLGLTVNAAILFGLVLVFVLLLVSTVVSEYRNRQELASANQRLRDYALMIENQATLHERNRIAREIHDSVGHALAAQSIQLENVAVTLASHNIDAMTDHLQNARKLGREALQSVRQSVATLRTNPLKQQTLPQAIATLLDEFKCSHPISVDAHLSSAPPLTDDQKIALYRITQEALTNIVKHSGAQHLQLSLNRHSTYLSLFISDDGQGFDPTANTTGFGLQSMRERTSALGGHFDLTSQPGHGCQIHITVPLVA